MNWSRDRVGALALLVLFVIYGLLSRNIELLPVQQATAMTARTLPQVFTILGILGAIWLMVFPAERKAIRFAGLHWWRFTAFLVLMSVYGLLLKPLGFILATLGFLSAGFLLLGERRWTPLLAIAVLVTGLFWMLLAWGLGVYLPPFPTLPAGGLE